MHIFKRGDRWAGSVELPRDPVTGKRKRKWASGRTKDEVEKKLIKVLHSVHTGTYTETSKIILAKYFENWLRDIKPDLTPQTYAGYEIIVNKHLIPKLGNIHLNKLQPIHIQNYITEARKEGRADGKGGLSSRTILHHYRLLNRALKNAVKLQLITRNVCDAVDSPRPDKFEPTVPERDAFITILEAAKDTKYEVPVYLAATTGMRRGEVLGLKWEDINFENSTLRVMRALSITEEGLELKAPKTKKSKRTIVLAPTMIDVLTKHKARQAECKLLLGKDYKKNDLVVCLDDGQPIHPNSFSDGFHDFLKNNKLPRIRFHDLRHTHATQLLELGIHPKIVSERLGHSTINITLDTYSHVMPNMQRDAVQQLDEKILKKKVK